MTIATVTSLNQNAIFSVPIATPLSENFAEEIYSELKRSIRGALSKVQRWNTRGERERVY